MESQYAIGIDLGTTNSVIAYAKLDDEQAEVKLLEIPQLVSPSTVESRLNLPSFCYLSTEAEKEKGVYDLEWEKGRDYVVGECARRQAADVPSRTVAAAKSWLAHSRVDRREDILPWGASQDVKKISPVEASNRYLLHLVNVWNQNFPDAPIGDQQVVLTVPASFDASARELTMEAANRAGLSENLVLLEEPQAAVYAWLNDSGDSWREKLRVGETLLVFDVGGGTTDFTLIGVEEEQGDLVLKRIAVGNHTLVGGDNMDLTLAHNAHQVFKDKGVNLDPWQSVALWHSCRNAKEQLLSIGGPPTHPVTVLGRGSKLIGGTVSADLSADETKKLLVDGFFPLCPADAQPAKRAASGFRELGLPFETDTGITRHLARFLRVQGEGEHSVHPTHILFNGGVFKADIFKMRALEVVQSWFGKEVLPLEQSPDLDYAVSRGAAYYAIVKQGKGLRIRGGTARSYYVGIETAGPAVPGMERPLSALCVVPFGMEEGTEIDVSSEEIGLVVGEPAKFRFFSSSVRKQDQAGDVLPYINESEMDETDSLEANLPGDEKFQEGYVPVKFQSRITELGMFELWCKSTVSDDSWKLEFSVRDKQ
ncbi:Hsp70 family protein [Chitinispirillales bacterium ANBcel5]|uniref:Hsp70 family protein n=1 Tax=Cellulosispirillum alkaliphilum TaxID=3039283 RepID=UPI002A56D5C0|nr:Hsp70 family protein [Chitinispirillales bacterium ANBcel5]